MAHAEYYKVKKPCGMCPFIKSTNFSFPEQRVHDLIYNANEFPCHKTTLEKDRKPSHPQARACAGRMIMLERSHQPDQMMRIAERLRMYNPNDLDMDHPDVFEDIEEFKEMRTE